MDIKKIINDGGKLILCSHLGKPKNGPEEKFSLAPVAVRLSELLGKEVVFANNGKTYQFSPTKPGGRYYKVTADELTIECVDRALRGEDYSQGALYFCMKTSSNSWFNTSLQFLFKHQDHYFYK